MKRKIILYIIIFIMPFVITGCGEKSSNIDVENINNDDINEVIESVKVVINNKEYTINLENNETVKSFVKLLPQEFGLISP